MNEKLTYQDIVDLLSKKNGLTKKDADIFLTGFFNLIIENIFDNEPVKIKSFGTFKLVLVHKRESVNVNTGEKIEIPAHYKLSFLPDRSLKELVNKPFSHFETTLLKKGVSFDSLEISEEELEDLLTEDSISEEAEIIGEKENTLTKKINDKKNESQRQEENIHVEQTQEIIDLKGLENSPLTPPISYSYTVVTEQKNSESPIIITLPTDKVLVKEDKPIPTNTIGKEIIEPHETVIPDNDPNENKKESNNFSDTVILPENADPDTLIKNEKYENIVYEDITEEIRKDKRADANILDNLVSVNEDSFDKEITSINISDTEEEQEIENIYNFYDYDKKSLWNKIYQRLPIIIFLLLIVGFGVYNFTKLFFPPNKEYILPYRTITEDDILPFAYKNRQSKKSSLTAPKDSIVVSVPGNSLKLITENPEPIGNSSSIPDTVYLLNIEQDNSKQISKNLKIKIVQKAAHQLAKHNNSFLTEIVKSGAGLRSIAKKYYGDDIYWIYIYKENIDKIKDFNNLPVGLELKIPSLTKYGININDPQAAETALRFEQTVLNRN